MQKSEMTLMTAVRNGIPTTLLKEVNSLSVRSEFTGELIHLKERLPGDIKDEENYHLIGELKGVGESYKEYRDMDVVISRGCIAKSSLGSLKILEEKVRAGNKLEGEIRHENT